jgi:hypothetical protein
MVMNLARTENKMCVSSDLCGLFLTCPKSTL